MFSLTNIVIAVLFVIIFSYDGPLQIEESVCDSLVLRNMAGVEGTE